MYAATLKDLARNITTGGMYMTKLSTFEQRLEDDIEKRIATMESDSYEKIPAINKKDIIAMVVTVVISIAGIIWGLL